MQPDNPQSTDHTTHYKQVLRDIVDMATDMACLAHKQAHHEATASTATLPPSRPIHTPFPNPAEAFDRIARTIRRTILLAEKLDQPSTNHTTSNRIAARKRILRDVEDAIQRNAKPQDRKALGAELLDRLDAPDLEDDLDTLSIDDIITDICHDLRVVHPYAANWKRRTPTDAATLRTRAAAIPETWTTPPRPRSPLPPRPKPPNPEPAAHRDDPSQILAEYARIIRDTG